MRTKILNSGFSLIELMVTVAIVGILASIAYPSYMNSVRKSNRTDAKSMLINYSQTLERCYTQNFAYNGACSAAIVGATTSTNNHYNITVAVTAPPANTYLITATPRAGDVQAQDAQCTSFTLNNKGVQGTTPAANAQLCWGTN